MATGKDATRRNPRLRVRRVWEAVPLRGRLVAILVVLLAGALFMSGGIVVRWQHAALMNDLDQSLTRSLRPLVDDALRSRYSNDSSSGRERGGPFSSDFVAYAIWYDGAPNQYRRPLYGSSLPDADPAFDDLRTMPQEPDKPFILRSTSGDVTWRVLSDEITIMPANQSIGRIYVATPMTRVHFTMRSLTMSLAAVAAGVILAGAVLGWILVRRSFRPLNEMEKTAAAIAGGDLSRRIPPYPPTTEVGRLTVSLNGMLAQIESAFRDREASEARTRRFAADASHELRTPLVSIRGFAELYRSGAVPPDEVPRTMRRIEDEAKRMGSLVEDLLLLARLDEQRPGRKDPVDLLVLAGDAVHDARGLDSTRAVALRGVDGAGPVPAVVTGDEDRLRQVVANLVANAIRHTPPGTPVDVGVGVRTGPARERHAVLEVRDHGPGLTDEQAQRVFERFYRVDSSRRRDTGGGSGLGLSIVAAVVASHAGRVEVHRTPGGGATFQVLIPARRPEAAREASAGITTRTPAHQAREDSQENLRDTPELAQRPKM
jgi:two-component system OmpR family sensor kinase